MFTEWVDEPFDSKKLTNFNIPEYKIKFNNQDFYKNYDIDIFYNTKVTKIETETLGISYI